jgi:hypothetical protein
MSGQREPGRASRGARERGQAMLLTVLLLAVGAAAVVYTLATPAKLAIQADKTTAAALSLARDALVGYAVQWASQPGVLPCPDVDNDGSADAPCGVTGATAIGRLPWKTLGLPALRDGAGECLWYAVSGNFKNSGMSGPAVLNSGSLGTLTVNSGTGVPVLTGANAALAIVFAPGAPLPSQDRTPTGTSVCGGNTNAANYLDTQTIGAMTFNNATGGGTNNFAMASTTPGPTSLNDKLMPITRDTLFPAVEMRVAREVRQGLIDYFNQPPGIPRQYFPLAAQFPNNVATDATYRGYVPTSNTHCLTDLALPAWFTTNNWQQFMVYAVAPQCTPKIVIASMTFATGTPTPPGACNCVVGPLTTTCESPTIDTTASNCNNTAAGPLLTVSGNPNVQAIVMPASYTLAGQVRPCTTIAECLEAVSGSNENIDPVDNYVYVKPVRSPNSNNDNLAIVGP